MDRMANQIDQNEGSPDVVKDMQQATATNFAPKSSSTDANSGDVGQGSSRGGGGSPVNDGGSDTDSDDGGKVIDFSPDNLEYKVFQTEDNMRKTFKWNLNDPKTILKELKWQVLVSGSGNVTTLDQTNFKSTKGTTLLTDLKNDTVTLNFGGNTAKYYEDDMYLEIDWEKADGVSGYSQTELFTVTDKNSDTQDLNAQISSAQAQQDAPEKTTSPGSSATSTSSPSSTGSSDSSSSSGGGGGGGGLSTGATAGIAVGAVIGGLLIIGALVWFLLRRRRRSKPTDDYVTQQTYAVDKETHNRGADSPNSPYSDMQQPVALDNLPRDRGMGSTPPPGGVPRSSIGSHDRGASGTPQGMSANVAHLVEDGMTADEIRRLEEEERQLDDEIERAARR